MTQRPSRTSQIVRWLEQRINLTEIFSLLTISGLFYTEVDTSKPLNEALKEALAKPLPSYSRWPRVLGLLTLILFVIELITGGLLAFYYRPTAQEAYSSILTIVRDIPFGWFIHQMHNWGAQLLLVLLIVRLIRFYFRGLYRSPRELIWVSVAILFLVATHLEFSGRLLAATNQSYWSSIRALEVLFSIPVIGTLSAFLVGGLPGDNSELTRFYFLHVAILPLVFWCGLYMSFSGIRRVGLSEIPGEEQRGGSGAYLAHLYSLSILALAIFGVLVTFSVLWATPFGEPVNPYQTAVGTQMPWYLLAPYGFIELFPMWIPLWVRSSLLMILLLVFIFFPALDYRSETLQRKRKIALAFGSTVFLLWLFFTYYGLSIDVRV